MLFTTINLIQNEFFPRLYRETFDGKGYPNLFSSKHKLKDNHLPPSFTEHYGKKYLYNLFRVLILDDAYNNDELR